MSGDVRNFNNIETRAVIKFFFLQGKAPKEIYAILRETLREQCKSWLDLRTKTKKVRPPKRRYPTSIHIMDRQYLCPYG